MVQYIGSSEQKSKTVHILVDNNLADILYEV